MGEIVRVDAGTTLVDKPVGGQTIGYLPNGTMIEIVSGPHRIQCFGQYLVVVGSCSDTEMVGKVGYFPLTESELGHPHGPVVPVPTEASVATTATITSGMATGSGASDHVTLAAGTGTATDRATIAELRARVDELRSLRDEDAVRFRKDLIDVKRILADRETQIVTLKTDAQTRLDRLDELYRERDGARHERDELQAALNKLGSEYAELDANLNAGCWPDLR